MLQENVVESDGVQDPSQTSFGENWSPFPNLGDLDLYTQVEHGEAPPLYEAPSGVSYHIYWNTLHCLISKILQEFQSVSLEYYVAQFI